MDSRYIEKLAERITKLEKENEELKQVINGFGGAIANLHEGLTKVAHECKCRGDIKAERGGKKGTKKAV